MMKILVTGLVPRAGLDILFENFDVTYTSGTPFSREKILKVLPDMDGVLLMGEKADKEFIDAGKNLKIISVNGVGYDNVDIAYAREKGITVCNSPQSVIEPTAEHTMCLMLAIARRVGNYDRNLRKGIWQNVSSEPDMGFCLYGTTLGIIGLGRIGKAVARRAHVFGMNILYYDEFAISQELEESYHVKRVSFNELLEKSDVVSLHTPLLESTRHLIGKEQLKRMKRTAFLVNAARGALIDEQALIEALQNGEIAGAGLDVFEHEPAIPQAMLALENVIMTPHAGTGCLSSRTILAGETAENIVAYLVNKNPRNVIN